jgi:hypothetical protein
VAVTASIHACRFDECDAAAAAQSIGGTCTGVFAVSVGAIEAASCPATASLPTPLPATAGWVALRPRASPSPNAAKSAGDQTQVTKSMVPLTYGCDSGSQTAYRAGGGSCGQSVVWSGTVSFAPGKLFVNYLSDESGNRDTSETMTFFIHGVQAASLVNTGCNPARCPLYLDWPGPGELKITQTSASTDGES